MDIKIQVESHKFANDALFSYGFRAGSATGENKQELEHYERGQLYSKMDKLLTEAFELGRKFEAATKDIL